MNKDMEISKLRERADKAEAAALQARCKLGEVADTVEQAHIGGWTQAHIDGLVDITRRAIWILEGK